MADKEPDNFCCARLLIPIMKQNKKSPKKKVSSSGFVFQSPRGMHDILPQEQLWIDKVEKAVKELADFYNFGRIETPIMESADLFHRTIGDETDIVQKEMYILKTKGGDSLALRPEGTAPIVRAYVEHGLGSLGQPQKLFYMGPFFRHENPQAGRYRQFSQVGFEILSGVNDAIYDSQIVLIFDRLLKALKIKGVSLRINSIGCRVCRPGYKKQLQAYYKRYEKEICKNCEERLKSNPLRIFDCKNKDCEPFKEKAPNFLNKICSNCRNHLRLVLEYMDELKISYSMDNLLVRGLDYYSQTVFEFFAEGSAGALAGGGRYDYLMEFLGGRPMPAVGGAAGIERLIEVMKTQEIKLPAKIAKKVFIIHVGELAKKKSLNIIEELRQAGISVAEALGKESVKAQLKVADKKGCLLAIIFGQKEIFEESVILRDLRTGLQETVILAKMVSEIQKRLRDKPIDIK